MPNAKVGGCRVLGIVFAGMILGLAAVGAAGTGEGSAIAAGHTAVLAGQPKQVPTRGMVDGPLMGNGDVGVVVAGPAENQQFYIGKNDFWRRNDASIIAVGTLSISMPALAGASYKQEQDMARAEVRGTFAKDDISVRLRSWVDANENLLINQVRNDGKSVVKVKISQLSGGDRNNRHAGDVDEKLATCSFTRKADAMPGSREVAVVTRVIDQPARADSGTLAVTLQPGQALTVATAILSDLDAKDFAEAARKRVASLQSADIDVLSARHQEWWNNFWAKSFIEIPDKEIESHWYAAQYVMGMCSREGKVPPGLWGNWITTDHPNWHGDFHTNYNFQGPFYIVYSSNHPELSLPLYQAMIDQIPNGRKMAERHGWKGIHFPVSLGPWGLIPEGPDVDWGQRSDAVFVAMNFIWQYQYTQDTDFLRKSAYPFLIEVANFWEDYLKFENGRYVIYNDSIHEGSGPDMNPLLSLGLVRTLFKNIIVMSRDLGVDESRRAKWQDICDKMSAYPTQERNGKTVFRYSEKGTVWVGGNDLGIHHIFPAGDIGLDSDPRTLEISRNMIEAMHRWSNGNGFCSWYTACARVAYEPKTVLSKLHTEIDNHSMPNLVLQYGGGGIENVSGFLAINEMMLQSYDGVIRLFPAWPVDQDARFGTLRAVGAFLVSAEIKSGVTGGVIILSERGRDCTIVNPWPGKPVRLARKGKPSETLGGERFTFKTDPGETVGVAPVEGSR